MDWYYTKDRMQAGPVSREELLQKISTGEVSSNQMAWCEGMSDWQPISNLPDLQVTVGLQQGPPPPNPAGARPVPPSVSSMRHAPTRTSGLAIASLCLGIASFFIGWFLTAIPAIICGHMALGQIKRSPAKLEGKAMAVIGLIIGYFITLLTILFILFVVFMWSVAKDQRMEQEVAQELMMKEVLEEFDEVEDGSESSPDE